MNLGDLFYLLQHLAGAPPSDPTQALKHAPGTDDQYFPGMRRLKMLEQMKEAEGVSDAVPRGPVFTPAPPATQSLPELSPGYQPPHRWNYGRPVRMAGM